MSAAAIQQTLLPRAAIDAFYADTATRDALGMTMGDWRMARVALNTHKGGLEAATDYYRSQPSPDLVVVELPSAANDVEGAIDQLASHCQPGTGAIVLGQTNDVRLYRRLTEMGVSDYLVGPYGTEELIGSFAKGLANVSGAGGKLVAVIGAKGGVGATTLSQALAWMGGEYRQGSSFIADLNGLSGTSGIAFGCEAKRSMDELLESIADGKFDAEMLSRVAEPVGDYIRLLPGGRGIYSPDTYATENIEALLAEARTLGDVTVVDVPAGMHPLTRYVAAMADHVVMVTTPLLSSLRNARMMMDELKQKRGGDAPISIVVNNVGLADRAELPLEAVKDALEVKTVHSVSHAPNLFTLAETHGKYFANDRQAQKVLRDLKSLVEQIYVKQGSQAAAQPMADAGLSLAGLATLVNGLMPKPKSA
ncbi:MAG: hypothetical protein AAF213_06470 [Pseudomonadota bacterium]